MIKRKSVCFLFILCFCCAAYGSQQRKYPRKDSPHWLYLPNKIDNSKTYWVVVGVHGADWNNKGGFGMAGWVDRKDNVIVIAPKFGKTYQNANKDDQELLIGLFEKIQKEHKVYPKMFLFGFSGGSQFSHRFVMKRPEYVCGVSSHSGGSWGTDAYGKINDKAKHIPFAISCGEKDTGKAWGKAPYGRLDWYKRFEKIISDKGFFYKGGIWPNVGHKKIKAVDKMTEECFALATTGMLPSSDTGKKLTEAAKLASTGEFDKADKLKRELSQVSLKLPEDSGWHDSDEALALRKKAVKTALADIDTSSLARSRFKMYKKCLSLLNSEKKPKESAMLVFMQKCPPSYCAEKEGAQTVLLACNTAAENHVNELRAQKQLSLNLYRKYIDLWDGLEIQKTLLAEYNDVSGKQLEKILAKKEGAFKKRDLKAFIRKWQTGEAVNRATSELEKQP